MSADYGGIVKRVMKAVNALNVYPHGKGCESFLPFFLPERRVGNVEIKHEIKKKGDVLDVVSMRNAIFMGLKPCRVMLDRDVLVHWLIESRNGKHHASWMSTMPQEIEQHERQLFRAHGDVLVGGLGLGLASAVLETNPRVRSITVVEQNKDVIKLVGPALGGGEIVHDDLRKYLRECRRKRRKFDFAFYDIWCPTGQRILTDYVLPLRKKSVGIIAQSEIECWNEDEMIGQVQMSINSRMHFEFGAQDSLKISKLKQRQFNELRAASRETWPYWNWFRRTMCDDLSKANLAAEQYVRDLKDAEAFRQHWGRFTRAT